MHYTAPDTGSTQIGHCLHYRVHLVANLCSCRTSTGIITLLVLRKIDPIGIITNNKFIWVRLIDGCAAADAAAKLPVLQDAVAGGEEVGEILLEPFALLFPFVCGALWHVLVLERLVTQTGMG
jgi:hypothetical protein